MINRNKNIGCTIQYQTQFHKDDPKMEQFSLQGFMAEDGLFRSVQSDGYIWVAKIVPGQTFLGAHIGSFNEYTAGRADIYEANYNGNGQYLGYMNYSKAGVIEMPNADRNLAISIDSITKANLLVNMYNLYLSQAIVNLKPQDAEMYSLFLEEIKRRYPETYDGRDILKFSKRKH